MPDVEVVSETIHEHDAPLRNVPELRSPHQDSTRDVVDLGQYRTSTAKRALGPEHSKERNASFEEREDYDNDSNTWGVDPEERNFRGVMGELAFAKYADLQIDTSTSEWSDGGFDFDIRLRGEPTAVDIKTSNKEPKALMVKEHSMNADYYILAHLDGRTVTFYGGASRESLENGSERNRNSGTPISHSAWSILTQYRALMKSRNPPLRSHELRCGRRGSGATTAAVS